MPWRALALAWVISSTTALAEPLWLVNFNGEGEGGAPAELKAHGSNEVSASGAFRMPEECEEARMSIVPSDGPDGGLALKLTAGAVQNGAGYHTVARGQYLETNAITYEVLVKPSELQEVFNEKWGGQQILNQQPGGDIPQCWLTMERNGRIKFQTVSARVDGDLRPAQWSHVAGVCVLAENEGGECLLRLYINGELVQETSFPRGKGKLPKSLGLGCYLQKNKGDSFQGEIDAIAVSAGALEPSEFLLPFPKS